MIKDNLRKRLYCIEHTSTKRFYCEFLDERGVFDVSHLYGYNAYEIIIDIEVLVSHDMCQLIIRNENPVVKFVALKLYSILSKLDFEFCTEQNIQKNVDEMIEYFSYNPYADVNPSIYDVVVVYRSPIRDFIINCYL